MVDYDEKSVVLEWTPPKSDGGAQITHYIVQKKGPKSDSWENCAYDETPTLDEPLKCKVVDLKKKEKLQFRVIAVNKAGESPPSDPSEPHTVWYKKRECLQSNYVFSDAQLFDSLCLVSVAPEIDRTNLKITRIRVGKTAALDVDVIGEPAPDVKWFFNDKEILNIENYKVENVPHNTKFTIERGQRKQSGKYKIVATNEHGMDQEWVEIVFMGPPSTPLGESVISKTLNTTYSHPLYRSADCLGLDLQQLQVEMDASRGRRRQAHHRLCHREDGQGHRALGTNCPRRC